MKGILTALALRIDPIAAVGIDLQQHMFAGLIGGFVRIAVAAGCIFHIKGIEQLAVPEIAQRVHALRQLPAPLQVRRRRLRRRRNERQQQRKRKENGKHFENPLQNPFLL